jgi:hypothetical protein
MGAGVGRVAGARWEFQVFWGLTLDLPADTRLGVGQTPTKKPQKTQKKAYSAHLQSRCDAACLDLGVKFVIEYRYTTAV